MLKRRRAYLLALVAAAVLIFPWGVIQPRALDDLRNFVFDTFQRLAPRAYDPEAPTRVVGVDEKSLSAYGQWPWPRARLAELLDRLRELGAASIAFDFIFAEADRAGASQLIEAIPDPRARAEVAKLVAKAPSGDQILAQALSKAPATLGVTLTDAVSAPLSAKSGLVTAGDDPAPFLAAFAGAVGPERKLAEAARGLGATNWLPDHDQIVRRVPLVTRAGDVLMPSLALEALRIAQGEPAIVIRSSNASGQTAFGKQTGVNAIKVGAFEIATGPNAEVRPRYSHSDAVRDISAKDVLEGRVARDEIEGRIIFVGALATGLGDVRATPLEPVVPGVDVHAQIVELIASGSLLARPDWAPGLEFVVAALRVFADHEPALRRAAARLGGGGAARRRWAFRRRLLSVRSPRRAARSLLSESRDHWRLSLRRSDALAVRNVRASPRASGLRQIRRTCRRRSPRRTSGPAGARRRDARIDRAVFRSAQFLGDFGRHERARTHAVHE